MKFIETIKIKKQQLSNIDYHIKRANLTIYDHYNIKFNFEKVIQKILENIKIIDDDIYKLRIVYDNRDYEYSIEKYILKPIKNFKIVRVEDFFYRYKYLNRKKLDSFYSQREDYDNIIIAVNDFITDSYYSNLVFEKNNEYFIPDTYLLNGTKRKYYLDNKIIREKKITIKDLKEFDSIHFINAMIDLNEIVIKI